MRARLRTLLDQRATAWSQVQDIQARREKAGYQATTEDGETYSRALDDVERLSKDIEEEERADRADRAMNAIVPGQGGTNPRPDDGGEGRTAEQSAEAYRTAFDRWARRGMGALNAEQHRALEGNVDSEVRALGEATGAAGGFTVPTTLLQKMIEVQKAFGGVMQHAEVLTTSTGNTVQWPTNDDTGNIGAILAENTQVTEQDVTFGQGSLGAYMYTSRMVRASLQLLQDSAFDLERWLANKLGQRIGRAAAAHFATGTGTGQPLGLTTGLTKTVPAATVATITYDNLVDLEHAIDPAYRSTGRARYVLADDAVRIIRKLKDTQNRPLWVPSMAGGVPSTINGQPYTVDNGLPVVAANSRSVVYGDIEAAYVVRQVLGAQLMQLRERYADFLQVGFLGFQRLDGRVQDTSAAAVLVQPAV